MPAAGRGGLDPETLTSLYLDYASELRRFVVGVTRDGHLAEDVLHATFAKAAESVAGIEPATRKAWLFQVAYREALVLRRKQAVQEKAAKVVARIPRPAIDSPMESLARAETIERVRRAIEELPENQREVVRCRIFDERTFAEIANATGTPLGTVLTRMRLALAKLREGLSE